MLSGPSFRAAFFFSINSLILPGFSLDLTSINLLKPHYLLFRGFILLCVQLSKNITKCFFLLSFIFLVLILQSPCFICATWKHKQTIEQQPHRSCERIKNKNKTKSRHIPIDHGFYWYRWHCNGIIKGWLYCLTSELKWRFLVNNRLVFASGRCLVIAQIQFSLIKKIRSGRSEHSLVDVICVSPLMSACVSEAVEKIPNNDQKDYRKRSLCAIVCIATTCQYHHFGY